MQQLAHPEGELATSRAAANLDVAMCLSSYSNTSLEEVKQQGKDNPYMMQMCVVRDRKLTKQLLERAEGPRSYHHYDSRKLIQIGMGYKAIFMSVDVPILGRRLNEYRNNFTLPDQLAFPNILSTGHDEFTGTEGPNDFG